MSGWVDHQSMEASTLETILSMVTSILSIEALLLTELTTVWLVILLFPDKKFN